MGLRVTCIDSACVLAGLHYSLHSTLVQLPDAFPVSSFDFTILIISEAWRRTMQKWLERNANPPWQGIRQYTNLKFYTITFLTSFFRWTSVTFLYFYFSREWIAITVTVFLLIIAQGAYKIIGKKVSLRLFDIFERNWVFIFLLGCWGSHRADCTLGRNW